MHPSSRGLGHRPFTARTGIRIPLGVPDLIAPVAQRQSNRLVSGRSSVQSRPGAPIELVELNIVIRSSTNENI